MKEGKRKTLGRRTRDRSVSVGAICGGNLEPRVLEGKQTTEMSGSGDSLTTQTKPYAVHCRCLEQLCPSLLWAGACLPRFSSRLTPQGSWASAGRVLTYQVLGLSILLPGGDPGQPRPPTCQGCPVTRSPGGCTRGNTNWEVRQAECL